MYMILPYHDRCDCSKSFVHNSESIIMDEQNVDILLAKSIIPELLYIMLC